jgi:hypothetical protein
MAVAAPKRRSAAAPAPAPSRTTAPKRRKVAAAPARLVPARKPPARKPPQRARPKPKPKRASTQPRLALVVGRTAATVRDLPDSGLIVRMTRGRVWIGVLGVLLVGIVALNVVTLSFAASLGKIDEEITALESENTMVSARAAKATATKVVRHAAAAQGLVMSIGEQNKVLTASPNDVPTATQRLAAAGG